MHKRSLSIFAALLVGSLIISACTPFSKTETPAPSPTAAMESSAQPAQEGKKKAVYEFTATESGTIALDLIASQAEVETKDYGNAGKFVTNINGLEGNNDYYWAFYLNDRYAEKGASQTTLAKGDIIKFVYEAVTLTK